MGMLNAQGTSEVPSDPILAKIEQGIEEKIPPQFKNAYLAIVVAGNKVLFSPQSAALLAQVVRAPDFMQRLPGRMANLMATLSNESGKDAQGQPMMKMEMLGPATMTLTCHVLGFAENAGGVKLDQNTIANAIQSVMQAVLPKFGIGKQQLQQAMAQQSNAQVTNQGV